MSLIKNLADTAARPLRSVLRKLALRFKAAFGETDGVKLVPWSWGGAVDLNKYAYLNCASWRKSGVAPAKRAARKARRKAK